MAQNDPPGARKYVVATKITNHRAPCIEKNFAGQAIKQKAAPGGTGLGATALTQIGVGEQFVIITKGLVYLDNTVPFAEGDPVYIVAATNALTAVSAGNVKFGRVYEVAGQRGVGTGKMRVDLDAKDGF
jgi:Uncharacterized conserved protein (DUF2190)